MKTFEDFEQFFGGLKQQRDELKLKLHLLKADVRDEWEKADKKWKQLRKKMEQFRSEAKKAARNPDKAIENLAKELKEKYEQIRQHL